MKLRTKLLIKTLSILIIVEAAWFFLSMTVAAYLNDFIGRSLAGIGFIIIPLVGTYLLMFKKLCQIEDQLFNKYLEEQNKKNGNSSRRKRSS